MSEKILVSIVIPVYNVEPYIGKTIESVQQQDFESFEIILVDDGSKDLSGEICDRYAQKDNRIKVIHQANGGVMSARYAGVDSSRGEYIAFLDGDDRMPPSAISVLYRAIKENNVDYVNGCDIVVDDQGNQLSPVEATGFDGIIEGNAQYRRFIAVHPRGMNLKIYRKEVLIQEPRIIIDNRIKNNEDYIFNLFLASKINKVMSIKDVVVHIVAREGSASRQIYNEDYWVYVLQWLDANFQKYDIYEDDLVRYKLFLIYGHFVRNKAEVDYSLSCFDNIKSYNYSFDLGMLNLSLFVVKHPWRFLFPILRFHPKYCFKKIFNI